MFVLPWTVHRRGGTGRPVKTQSLSRHPSEWVGRSAPRPLWPRWRTPNREAVTTGLGHLRPSTPGFLVMSDSFTELGLLPELVEALTAQNIHRPTRIQQLSVPAVMGGANTVVGAATGSGKTLAYLLPIVHNLKVEEQLPQRMHTEGEAEPPVHKLASPRVLVLAPTRELVDQILLVCKQLAHYAKFRARSALGIRRQVREALEASPVDVLVSTTTRFLHLVKERLVHLSALRVIVFDEVDTLVAESAGFAQEVRGILKRARRVQQLIAVGATHPPTVRRIYEELFPKAKYIEVDLHRTPQSMKQRFLPVFGDHGKTDEVLTLLRGRSFRSEAGGGRMIVFCNSVDSCRFLDHFLREHDYPTANYHGDIPKERREAEYEAFARGERRILVCTDLAARGLDYDLAVDHVIMFDFPRSAVEYLHRAGRTARGPHGTGTVTAFVGKRDVELAGCIEEAVRQRGVDVVAHCAQRLKAARMGGKMARPSIGAPMGGNTAGRTKAVPLTRNGPKATATPAASFRKNGGGLARAAMAGGRPRGGSQNGRGVIQASARPLNRKGNGGNQNGRGVIQASARPLNRKGNGGGRRNRRAP
ncbi:hypothetical protein CDCA_CDCA03G0961 [Cyanidium caldarium]|uniref:Uncharacterized protein n=1 Tax=Cyanidium caldarium TaxID=2771 RepID=A0AAV9IRX5_CYACA|nr:hypothetical protein CDCA_CDCA03G0961 [Cyanidium caldarium]